MNLYSSVPLCFIKSNFFLLEHVHLVTHQHLNYSLQFFLTHIFGASLFKLPDPSLSLFKGPVGSDIVDDESNLRVPIVEIHQGFELLLPSGIPNLLIVRSVLTEKLMLRSPTTTSLV